MGNKNLNAAKRNKNDEFYTQYIDIEKEVNNYWEQLKGKIVYCNTDNYKESNFVKYFVKNFDKIQLKKLISLDLDGNYFEYDGKTRQYSKFEDGDFRSEKSKELLKGSDVVCTNPPFSLFREYVAQLMEYEKEFLTIGNFNAVKYKEVFPLIKGGKVKLGHNSPKEFVQPDGNIKKVFTYWFTNMDVTKRHQDIPLHKTYKGNEDAYPTYDNYDVIEVSRVNNIPRDYEGVMGVPITFLTKYNPKQFEIIGIASRHSWANYKETLVELGFNEKIKCGGGLGIAMVNGKAKYDRILIKNKKPEIKGDTED